ncbi:hypothetical protein [Piscinibacter terrae]|nr:hypothetical protein [Albitalea terrae]
MSRLSLAAGLAAVVLAPFACVPLARAASVLDFDVWMRAIDKRSVAVQKSIARRDAVAARADAQEIERLYALMQTYFVDAGNASDAVQISRDGKDLASSITGLVDAQDFDGASQAALRIAQACNDCHDAYKPFK